MGGAGNGCIDRYIACSDPGNSVFFFRHQRISKRSGVHASISKETNSILCFSRGGGPGPQSPPLDPTMDT